MKEIPDNISQEERNKLIDKIILEEASKLQVKYRAIYTASDNTIYNTRVAINELIRGEKNVHDVLEPLYTYYNTEQKPDSEAVQLLKIFGSSALQGAYVGIWSEVDRASNDWTKNVYDVAESAEIIQKGREFTSNAPLVGELATELDAAMPGIVKDVNRDIYGADGFKITDLNIELGDMADNVVIQVKTGGGQGLTKQMIKTSKEATEYEVIAYVPNINLQ